MTNIKEILKNRTVIQMFGKDFVEGALAELVFARSAIEQQIPEKPFHDGEDWICPACAEEIEDGCHSEYCRFCGKNLDWSV